MSIGSLAKKANHLIADNSPAILTAVGVAGTITTAVLVGKATFKAADILREAENEDFDEEVRHDIDPLTPKEKVLLTYKLYLPAVASGSLTVAAIVGANRIGTRRAAAVAAAYSISERAFDEYRAKVVEKFGENKAREVHDEVVADRVRHDLNNNGVLDMAGVEGKVMIHEAYTGRFFWSTVETVRKAQNDINYRIGHEDSQSMSDFYDLIGLQHTALSDVMGWNTADPMELTWTVVAHPNKEMPAAHSFSYGNSEGAGGPIMSPWKAASFR